MVRVCYFGTYRAHYSRNLIMIQGLRLNGVCVSECQVPLWTGIEDRVQAASGGWLSPRFILRVIAVYVRLLARYARSGDYDVLVVGYPGVFDVWLARLLSWLRRRPLVWDIFMSTYLIAMERGLDRRSSLTVRLLRAAEWAACRLPDRLILDTSQYAAWFHQTHGVDRARFRLVPTGADDRVFRPSPQARSSGDTFVVCYYGSYIPNHGVATIVESARLLRHDDDIRFWLIGNGPCRAGAEALARQYQLSNITFIDWLPRDRLVPFVCGTDVCLGVFGTTAQSLMTIQNKIFEGLAMARPVITGDAPAVREQFRHGMHLLLCERANPAALAEALRLMRADPALRGQIAEGGYRLFKEKFDPAHVGTQFRTHLLELLNPDAPPAAPVAGPAA